VIIRTVHGSLLLDSLKTWADILLVMWLGRRRKWWKRNENSETRWVWKWWYRVIRSKLATTTKCLVFTHYATAR